jgi:hypothetical protein
MLLTSEIGPQLSAHRFVLEIDGSPAVLFSSGSDTGERLYPRPLASAALTVPAAWAAEGLIAIAALLAAWSFALRPARGSRRREAAIVLAMAAPPVVLVDLGVAWAQRTPYTQELLARTPGVIAPAPVAIVATAAVVFLLTCAVLRLVGAPRPPHAGP